jgi:hypothetical protein
MITSDQIRAGRALLRWSAVELANRSGVGLATVKRMEAMSGLPHGQVRTLSTIRFALEEAGIEFVGSPGDRPGVRLRIAFNQKTSA